MNAVKRARELGTEHGTAAAKAWLNWFRTRYFVGSPAFRSAVLGTSPPEPDLEAAYVSQSGLFDVLGLPHRDDWDEDDDDGFDAMLQKHWLPYAAAFTAAVEATIREAVES